MVPTTKETIRREIFTKLRATPKDVRAHHSAEICKHICASPSWKPGATIHLFAALPSEPNLLPLIQVAQKENIRLAFPLVTNPSEGSLTFHAVTDAHQLTPHSSPIPEPAPDQCPEISPQEITAAFLPGVAFDPSTGTRLGRGGGFYDRFLASPSFTAPAIGICFSSQLHPLQPEPHDLPVSALITEQGLFALPAHDAHLTS